MINKFCALFICSFILSGYSVHAQHDDKVRFFVDQQTNSEDPEKRMAYGLNIVPGWPDAGSVFVNLPEHLEYMPGTKGIARHHDNRRNVWNVSADSTEANYLAESLTEPGVFFSVKAKSNVEKSYFEVTIDNKSSKYLNSIRPLFCFQYNLLKGFPPKDSDNFRHTYIIRNGKPVPVNTLIVKDSNAIARMAQVGSCPDQHNWWAEKMGGFIEQNIDAAYTILTAENDERKVIVRWTPGKNFLSNAAIPCIHADPCIGDLAPGESRIVYGELIFTHLPLKEIINRYPVQGRVVATNTPASAQTKDSVWKRLAPYFSPPAKYANQFGTYRSPLVFDDGKKVKTRSDWQKRRKEIYERWQNIMGKWPEVIHHPQFQIIDSIRKESYTQYHVKFEWRKEELSAGYLLVPDGKGSKAAVVIVYYEPETAIGLSDRQDMDLAVQLAKRGIVAFSIGADPVAKFKPYGQYYPTPDSASVQPLSMLGYLAANAWNALANLSFIDSSRIGITGHSYGSKWAMFASCLYDNFACAAWSDGGIVFDESRPNVNYQDPWYLGYYPPPWGPESGSKDSGQYHRTQWGVTGRKDKGAYAILRKQGYDLHELHALMAPRPFLVSGGSEDPPERWIALNHTIKVNALLGYKHRVGITQRLHHAPTAQSNDEICNFFEYFLKYNPAAKK